MAGSTARPKIGNTERPKLPVVEEIFKLDDADKKLAISHLGDKGVKCLFQTFAYAAGLYGYKFASMDEIAQLAHEYYDNDLRGGEGHIEVGKLIANVIHQKAHMRLSVKPFGCMPSAGVSDGVQMAITEKFPGTIFCPVETSGDGPRELLLARPDVPLQGEAGGAGRIRARAPGQRRHARAGRRLPRREPEVPQPVLQGEARLLRQQRGRRRRGRAVHHETRAERWKDRITAFATGSKKAIEQTPHLAVSLVNAVKDVPKVAERVKEDITILRELRTLKKNAPKHEATLDAAAEE